MLTRTRPRRSRPALALIALSVVALALAGCGGDDDDDAASPSGDTSETDATDPADDDGDDTVAETTAPAEDDDDTATTDTTVASPSGQTPADSATDPWAQNTYNLDFDSNDQIEFECPPDGTADPVWGTNIYTDDSSICNAAVHAGLITFEDGGTVLVELAPGQESYEASEMNGVTSLPYGSWAGSFVFPESQPGS